MDFSALPSTLLVKTLDVQHSEYVERANLWCDLDVLNEGGDTLKRKAARFLVKKPQEVSDVYATRCNKITYQNCLGSGTGWYKSAMFADKPDFSFRTPAGPLAGDSLEFYNKFLLDCNRGGKSFSELYGDVLIKLLLFQSAYVLVDLPKASSVPVTLADQRAAGLLDPFLVLYDPRQVINWEADSYGRLQWVVVNTTDERRAFAKGPEVVDRWYYFDRTMYGIYEAERRDDKKAETAELIDAGPHALADVGRVPVHRIEIPVDLWIGKRVYLQVLDHLNTDNGFAWALFMSCYPMPIIKGDYENRPIGSETAFLQLSAGSEFLWAEPSGNSYEALAARVGSLREEIYRQMYLQAQGRSSAATPAMQSGYSKEIDMAPSRDVLNALGDVLRDSMSAVLADVAEIRGDKDVSVSIRGLSRDDADEADELTTAQLALDMQIPSVTFEREMRKRAVRSALPDASEDTLKAIDDEIDAAPSAEERAAAAAQQQRERIRNTMMQQGAAA